MKHSSILLILFLLFALTPLAAQETNVSSAKWNRIESDTKDFSIAVPPAAVIDAEERKYGQKLRIAAFQNGVEIELVMIKDGDLKNRPGYIRPNDLSRLVTTKVGEFAVLQIRDDETAKKFETTFRISKKDTLYSLKVCAKTGREAELARFLFSINLDGKALFVPKEKTNFPEEIISFSALKTTREVSEAFDRKIERNKIKISYEASSNELNEVDYDGMTRKAVILERPSPTLTPGAFGALDGSYNVRLKVNLLANGQIGDITVLSVENRDFAKACIEATRRIRFVPAQINGQNADTIEIVEYRAEIFSTPGTVIRR